MSYFSDVVWCREWVVFPSSLKTHLLTKPYSFPSFPPSPKTLLSHSVQVTIFLPLVIALVTSAVLIIAFFQIYQAIRLT